MKIKRRLLEKMIREEIAPNMRANISTARQNMLESLKIAVGVAETPFILEFAATGFLGTAEEVAETGLEKGEEELTQKIFGAGRATVSVSTLMLSKTLFESFTYLPGIMKKQLENMKTVEGILKYYRQQLGRPINSSDFRDGSISQKSPITGSNFTKLGLIDTIAASLEDKSGQSFFGMLIASQHLSLSGFQVKGAVISQEFANEIQQRRKVLKEETAKKIKGMILSAIPKMNDREMQFMLQKIKRS